MKTKEKPLLRGCIKTLFFIMALLYVSLIAKGQVYLDIIENSQTRNFEKIVNAIEEYYKDKDKGKGSGYKQFKRWEEFNKYHLDENGDLQNATQLNFREAYQYKLRINRNGLRTEAFPSNWNPMGPFSYVNSGGWNGGIGRVNCITIDPSNSSIIYAGTPAGGLWRSLVGGNSWTSLTDGISSLGISGIVVDRTSPVNNRTLFILTGDGDGGNTRSVGVMRSIDNGLTWQSTGLTFPVTNAINGYKLVMSPVANQILMAATNVGIYRTTDGGINWVRVLTGATYDIEFKPSDPNIVYAACQGAFYRSVDGGAIWTQITSGIPTSGRLAIAVSPNNSNYVYLLQGTSPVAGKFGGLYRSANSGVSFTLRSNAPNILGYATNGDDNSSQGWYDLAIAISPTNAEEVHTGGISCWKSTNGGTSWAFTSNWYESGAAPGDYTHADIHSLDFYGSTLYCGSDGGLSKSTNNAGSWATIWNGLQVSQSYKISVDAVNPDKYICGTQDNGSNRFENGTYFHEQGGDGMQCAIDQSNTNIFYTSVQNGGFSRTTNNGGSFTGITPSGQSGDWVTPFLISPSSNTTLFAGYIDIWRSTNQGTAWTNISSGKIGTKLCNHMEIAPSNTAIIFVAKGSVLYKTSNSGTSWVTSNGTAPNNLPTQNISKILIDPSNQNTIWISYGSYVSGNKVYKSTNGGDTWTNISGTLPNIPINCLAYKNTGSVSKIFAGSDIGVFVLESTASDWVEFSNRLPNVIIKDLQIRGDRLYAGTFGRGVWRTNIDGCPASLTFSGSQSGQLAYETSQTITSSAEIANNSNIKYKAGQIITLSLGFSITSNSITTFEASIGECGSQFRFQSDLVSLSGRYTGPMDGVNNNPISGIYTGPMEGVTIAQSEEADQELASKKLLVFPHPTINITTVEYYVQNEGDVSISISDINGKKLKDLMISIPHRKGKYATTFDASLFPTGLYTCTFILDATSTTIKLVVK